MGINLGEKLKRLRKDKNISQEKLRQIKYKGLSYLYRKRPSSIMRTKTVERDKKYYESILMLYDAYKERYELKEYICVEAIKEAITRTNHYAIFSLCRIPDTTYVLQNKERVKGK